MGANSLRLFGLSVLCLLAACMGPDPTAHPADTTASIVAPHEPQFTDDTGAILVRVTTTELTPISGAQVALAEPGLITSSNALGEAFFDRVTPGSYRLLVDALGYEGTARKVQVEAAVATTISISLAPLPTTEPYSELVQRSGIWRCSVSYVGDFCTYAANNGYTPEDILYAAREGWSMIVLEADSKPPSTLGIKAAELTLWGNQSGQSERIIYGAQGQRFPFHVALDVGKPYPGYYRPTPLPEGPIVFQIRFFPYSMTTTDVFLTLDQKYDAYLTAFYLEPGARDHSALPDR